MQPHSHFTTPLLTFTPLFSIVNLSTSTLSVT
jgi:hypothetical protein